MTKSIAMIKLPYEQTLRGRILDACKWATEEKGLLVRGGDWGVELDLTGEWRAESAHVCPLGALLLKEQPSEGTGDPQWAAELLIAKPYDWVRSFIAAVDGRGESDDEDGYYEGLEVITRVAKKDWTPPPLVPENAEVEPPDIWNAMETIHNARTAKLDELTALTEEAGGYEDLTDEAHETKEDGND